MATDYIPNPDDAFTVWEQQFVSVVTASPTSFGLVAADATALGALQSPWESSQINNNAAQNNARTARVSKDEARADFEALIRATVRRIQAFPGITDALRTSLGITVPDGTPTPNLMVPSTRPVAQVDTSESLRHTIKFYDESTPTSRAKPHGVKGCEIWAKIGATPVGVVDQGSAGDMAFVALDTASPYVASYTQAHAGESVFYKLRWITTRDALGPWSETVEATVVA